MSNQIVSTPLLDGIKENASVAVTAGVILLIMGVLALASPLVAGLSVTIMVGILLMIGGVGECFLAFKAGAFGKGLLIFVTGLLMALAGLYMVTQPGAGMMSLTMMLVIYLVVTGVIEVMIAFQARPEEGWGWLLFSAIMTLLLGAMLWQQFPLSGVWAVGVLFGVKMISSGWSLVFIGRSVKKITQAVKSSL